MKVEKMGQKVLKIEALTHGYPTRPLFKDVNLDLEKGDRVAIIGPNGAGGMGYLTLTVRA
jgi:ATPase subunit of ABC transporter with duplicated ATPase domains